MNRALCDGIRCLDTKVFLLNSALHSFIHISVSCNVQYLYSWKFLFFYNSSPSPKMNLRFRLTQKFTSFLVAILVIQKSASIVCDPLPKNLCEGSFLYYLSFSYYILIFHSTHVSIYMFAPLCVCVCLVQRGFFF